MGRARILGLGNKSASDWRSRKHIKDSMCWKGPLPFGPKAESDDGKKPKTVEERDWEVHIG